MESFSIFISFYVSGSNVSNTGNDSTGSRSKRVGVRVVVIMMFVVVLVFIAILK